MRRFSANYVYTNTGKPIRNGVVGVDDNGVVVEIIDHKGEEKEYAHTEFRNGIIVPGFVNANCHTERSHLKGKIQQKEGMANFIILCPSSNQDANISLPNIEKLLAQGLTIVFGTDSNTNSEALSILEQIKIILNSYPEVTFEELLKWATINGARALGLDTQLGTIELGKPPGLNLITPFDFTLLKPKQNSRLVKLV
jgi:cytosine/adenosine deaminase-related metal-dependent hydrolase